MILLLPRVSFALCSPYDDLKFPVGPIFLAFPDAQKPLQMVSLCESKDPARHLLEHSIT